MVFPILCYVLRRGCDLKLGKAVGEMGHLSHTPTGADGAVVDGARVAYGAAPTTKDLDESTKIDCCKRLTFCGCMDVDAATSSIWSEGMRCFTSIWSEGIRCFSTRLDGPRAEHDTATRRRWRGWVSLGGCLL